MKTKDTIKTNLRNIAFVSLYAAGFGLVFAFGIFAMNGDLEHSVSVETSKEESQEKILTVYENEIDESIKTPSQKVVKRI